MTYSAALVRYRIASRTNEGFWFACTVLGLKGVITNSSYVLAIDALAFLRAGGRATTMFLSRITLDCQLRPYEDRDANLLSGIAEVKK